MEKIYKKIRKFASNRNIILTLLFTALLVSILVYVFVINPYKHPIGFGVYAVNSTLLPQFKTYYANATSNDILIDDAYSPVLRGYLKYWNVPEVFGRMVLDNNYSTLISTRTDGYEGNIGLAREYNFGKNDYVGLDDENWNYTPIYEQLNQSFYVQQSCTAVHNAGYKFAYTPELDGNTGSQIAEINWSCVDFFDMQEQALSNNTAQLARNVSYLLSLSKGKNRNLTVFVQLDMNANETNMKKDISALSGIPGVNGVILQYICDPGICNTSTLTSLVNYTQEQKANPESINLEAYAVFAIIVAAIIVVLLIFGKKKSRLSS